MDERELASLLKAQGWMYKLRARRKGKMYIYARRRNGARMIERYIAPVGQIARLTSEEVLNKLQPDCPKRGTANECVILGGFPHSFA